jgi:2-polyprenyl-3-methyl-5-hydroxy-6-metoxy-1,4-benzoquinol methylase
VASIRQRRLSLFHGFLRAVLPAPARLLEIGCGRGELARALAGDGHDVTAIDPAAPAGPIFRRLRLEDFVAEGPFDVTVASVSLHHVDDLAAGLERIEMLLRPGGLLVLEEFAKERFTGAAAEWYYHQRRALAAAGRENAAVPAPFARWRRQWTRDHAEIHTFAELRAMLGRTFTRRHFEWTPYLYSYALDDSLEPAERALIESGGIVATGCRYVGERLP